MENEKGIFLNILKVIVKIILPNNRNDYSLYAT